MKLHTNAPSLAAALLALSLAISGCGDTDLAGRILSLAAGGAVIVLVYLDRKGD